MRALLLLAPLCACAAPPAPPLPESERGVDVGAVLHVASHNGREGPHTVRAVRGDAPGESDLELDGAPLAPAAGPDDLPLLLDDGSTVVFVSGRSGVASLWRVDVDGGGLRQLTNRGQRPGHLDAAFVPPPARAMREVSGALVYDDGSGRLWRVDAAAGVVLR